MKKVTGLEPSEIVKVVREHADRAEFVTICDWDDGIWLNDAGQIAIPSRTKRSVRLETYRSDAFLLKEIEEFIKGKAT